MKKPRRSVILLLVFLLLVYIIQNQHTPFNKPLELVQQCKASVKNNQFKENQTRRSNLAATKPKSGNRSITGSDADMWSLLNSESHGSWQTVLKDRLYVYTAYLDPKVKPSIHVFAVANHIDKINCTLYCEDKTDPFKYRATFRYTPEHHNFPLKPTYVNCKIPLECSIPQHVSIMAEPVPEAMQNQIIKVPVRLIKMERDPIINYTVCVKPMYNFINSKQLVEFIEVNIMFGAQHFVLYDSKNNSEVYSVFDYYIKKRILTVIKWNLIEEIEDTKKIIVHGHVAAQNDCFYRIRYKSKFAYVIDIDEMIVPRKHSTLDGLINSKGLKYNVGFSFRNVFFQNDISDYGNLTSNPVVKRYNINCLLRTNREINPLRHGIRSKMIVRPEFVEEIGVHVVHKFNKKGVALERINPDIALLFHYRHDYIGTDICIRDGLMEKFAPQIISRISHAHESISAKNSRMSDM